MHEASMAANPGEEEQQFSSSGDHDDHATCTNAAIDLEACISKLPASNAALLIRNPSGTLLLGWDTKHSTALQRVLSHAESLRAEAAARDAAAEANLLHLQAEEFLATTYATRRWVTIVLVALDVAYWASIVIVQVVFLLNNNGAHLSTAGIRNQDIRLSMWVDNEGVTGQLSVVCLVISSVGFALTLLLKMNVVVLLMFIVAQVLTTVMVSIHGFSFFVIWRAIVILALLSMRAAILRYKELTGVIPFNRTQRGSLTRLINSFFSTLGGFLGVLCGTSSQGRRQQRQSPAASHRQPNTPVPSPFVFTSLTPAAQYAIANPVNNSLIGAGYEVPSAQQPVATPAATPAFAGGFVQPPFPAPAFPVLTQSQPGSTAQPPGWPLNSREAHMHDQPTVTMALHNPLFPGLASTEMTPAHSSSLLPQWGAFGWRAHATDFGAINTMQHRDRLSVPWQAVPYHGLDGTATCWTSSNINPMFGMPGVHPVVPSPATLAAAGAGPAMPQTASLLMSESRRRMTVDGATTTANSLRAAVVAAALDVQQLQNLSRARRAAQLQQSEPGWQRVGPPAGAVTTSAATGSPRHVQAVSQSQQDGRMPPVHAVSFNSSGGSYNSSGDDDTCSTSDGECDDNTQLAVTMSILPNAGYPATVNADTGSQATVASIDAQHSNHHLPTQEQLLLASIELQALRERIRGRQAREQMHLDVQPQDPRR